MTVVEITTDNNEQQMKQNNIYKIKSFEDKLLLNSYSKARNLVII